MNEWAIGGIILSVIIISVITGIVRRIKRGKKLKEAISNSWGKSPAYREDIVSVKKGEEGLNDICYGEKRNIDDLTWDDLDMDSVFERIDGTWSTPGTQFLYNLLRRPKLKASEIEETNKDILFYTKNKELSLKIQYLLAILGRGRYINPDRYIYEEKVKGKSNLWRYYLQVLAIFLSIAVMFVSMETGIVFLIIAVILNIATHYHYKKSIEAHLENLAYIVSTINCAQSICKIKNPEFQLLNEKLKKITKLSTPWHIRSFNVMFGATQDPFLEYFKVMFLGELIAFEKFFKYLDKNKENLIGIYESVGYLDTITNLASFRESLDYYCVPNLTSNEKPSLEVRNIYHILLENPISNNLSTKRSVLLTGSNASGKSTFLKSIMINQILAQSTATCLATECSCCCYKMLSSMAIKDSIKNNESYFIVEIKSLKRIIDAINEDIPILCVIDEVLRGTNTIERIAASTEILENISKRNCVCIAATHDIELTYLLKDNYDNYHFEEDFKGKDIIFDYVLKSGKAVSRNAIKLLESLGYENEIVEKAFDRAKLFEEKGQWIKDVDMHS